MSSYTIRYERDEEGWWVATAKSVKGCHTQGRSIDQARKRMREALELFVEDAQSAELLDDIVLPSDIKRLVNLVHSCRKRAREESEKLESSTKQAAKVLTEELGVSCRDAGELLGLSHQRVHQIVSAS